MITGVVNPDSEATIHVSVHDHVAQEQDFDAIIDTGFTGHLTLPATAVALLGLRFAGRQQVMLGDGSIALVDVYTGTVTWDGLPCVVEIDEADTTPLVGMALMRGYELRIQNIDGGDVTLTRL